MTANSLLLTVLWGCFSRTPPPAEPLLDSCETNATRYAIAVNATGQGLHVYTATGDFLIPCREGCAAPADYDLQELTRRMAAARPFHTVNKALLISEVPPAVESSVTAAMTEDPAHPVDGTPARLFDVVLGETTCMADLQTRILVPPRQPSELPTQLPTETPSDAPVDVPTPQ
jgi:hypothetical protein